jgi:quinol monooxygenase YgiN
MLIVAGTFEVDPDLREEFLRSKENAMRVSRRESGCHDYVFSADPLEPGRVVLYERWEDKASLAGHLAGLRSQPVPESVQVPIITQEIVQFEISAAGALGS